MDVPPKVKKEAPAPIDEVPEPTSGTELLLEQSTKSSSKKRAKARKDREGLQALLSKSSQNKSSPSLSLMDLMRR